MLNNSLMYHTIAHNGFGNSQTSDRAQRQAGHMFWRIYAKGRLHRIMAQLTGRCNRLAALTQEQTGQNGRYAGLRTVPIQQIRGSEGRSQDFDAQFQPIQLHNYDRWVDLMAAMLRGVPLPPVELIQVGDVYFVRDGNHRISTARFLGQVEIDAQVTVMG